MRMRWLIPPLVLLALAGGGVGGAYAYDRAHDDVLAEGVSVAGVDVGGLRVADARAKLERELVPQLGEPVALTFRRNRFEITPEAAGVTLDVGAMVGEAHDASRRETFFERAAREARGRTVDVDVPLRIAYSREAVADAV